MTSLLGEEFWSKFPEEEQKRLLSLESHFVFLQYEEAFGYKSDAWVLDYWRLIENPIINCVACVRGDTTFLGPFISICSSLKIEVEKDKELSAAHAIKILRNFRSFAPQFKEKFIERLSFYGIQAHLLTSELLDKIDRLRKIRNNCVHGRRTNPSDDPAKDFRKIFFEAYPAFYHAIKR